MIDYTGTTALVTGAASGIGKALAKTLSERGARVICADRNIHGAEETAKEIGNAALAIAVDLSEPDAASALIEQCSAMESRLDLICSNAGIGLSGRVVEQEMVNSTELSRLFEVNFFAALKIAQTYAKILQTSGQRGRLMVTASENSLSIPAAVNKGRMGFYGASKHALLVALEWMQIDMADGPLDLHVLLPGAVYTPLVSSFMPDPSKAPVELELIYPQQCAEIALRGMDKDLFYIPTQAHLHEDMQPRADAIAQSLQTLGIEKTY